MDLSQLLQSQLSEDMIAQLSQQLGGVDKQKTAVAASGAVSTIIAALQRNAASPDGAAALANALERDHDGSILDDVMGMITGNKAAPENSRMLNGSGILKHVLGGKQSSAIDMISQMSGLSSDKTGSLMTMLAPVVMGMLGKAKKQNDLDAGGISDLLSGFVTKQKQGDNPALSMAASFLDKNKDGSIIDDILRMLSKLLGSLFGGKK